MQFWRPGLWFFKLLRQSCKCGLYSHAGEALPALLPPYCSGRERGEKRQIKTTQAGTVLPSAPQVFSALSHHSSRFTQGTILESSNLATEAGESYSAAVLQVGSSFH